MFYGGAVSGWLHQDVEIIGAIDQAPGQDPTQVRRRALLVWSILEPAKSVTLVRREKDEATAR